MKTLHFEFDAIVTDKSAQELLDASEVSLQDNIMEALDIYDECEDIKNFSIKIKENK